MKCHWVLHLLYFIIIDSLNLSSIGFVVVVVWVMWADSRALENLSWNQWCCMRVFSGALQLRLQDRKMILQHWKLPFEFATVKCQINVLKMFISMNAPVGRCLGSVDFQKGGLNHCALSGQHCPGSLGVEPNESVGNDASSPQTGGGVSLCRIM